MYEILALDRVSVNLASNTMGPPCHCAIMHAIRQISSVPHIDAAVSCRVLPRTVAVCSISCLSKAYKNMRSLIKTKLMACIPNQQEDKGILPAGVRVMQSSSSGLADSLASWHHVIM